METHILLGLCIFLFIVLAVVWSNFLDYKKYNPDLGKRYPINDNIDEIVNSVASDVGHQLMTNSYYKDNPTERRQVEKNVKELMRRCFSTSKEIQIPSNAFYEFALNPNKDITQLKESHEAEWEKLYSFAAFLTLCTNYSKDELKVLDHKINLTKPEYFSDQETMRVVRKEELEEVLLLIVSAEQQYIQEHKSDIINKAKNNLLSQCILTRPVDEKVEKLREIIENEKNSNGTA